LHRKLERINDKAENHSTETMVTGNSSIMRQMFKTIKKVSESDASILVLGETGTGKSMFAKLIHKSSSRADKHFFTIDCGALAEHLLESELFGHVKGAFTGAVRARRGLLEEAQGGTIFLDEIGELTLATQVKLLRAIQEREIKPVGGNNSVHIDVRFISATSRDLDREVEQGRFRKDLFYRLAVIPLKLPPLRERKEDIVMFVDHFIQKFNMRYKKKVTDLAPSVMQVLLESPWQGNIRELENVMERAVLLTEGNTVTLNSLFTNSGTFDQPDIEVGDHTISLKKAAQQAEIRAIEKALEMSNGNRSKASKILGIGRRTLYDKMEVYNID
jgi:transcriptional regulator with PAS, ATPase and Fis domain